VTEFSEVRFFTNSIPLTNPPQRFVEPPGSTPWTAQFALSYIVDYRSEKCYLAPVVH
jgi:hypothetical protein